MGAVLIAFLAAIRSTICARAELEVEILALRHQLAVLQRAAPKRPQVGRADRLLWVLLSRFWKEWRPSVRIVQLATVVRWHRRAFAVHWRWRSRCRRVGRSSAARDIRALIRQMRSANPLWGAPVEYLNSFSLVDSAVRDWLGRQCRLKYSLVEESQELFAGALLRHQPSLPLDAAEG
jgi:hypothetical protein